jgi:hypothetical protein
MQSFNGYSRIRIGAFAARLKLCPDTIDSLKVILHEALLIEIVPRSDEEYREYRRGLEWDCAGKKGNPAFANWVGMVVY